MKITNEIGDNVILEEIGARVEALRLERNLTQAEIAARAGVSKSTIERIEDGKTAQFASFIRIVRALGLLAQFETLLPEPIASPIDQLKLRRNQRRRASAKREKNAGKTWSWGDGE